jgi:hypothetical protein
MKELNKTKSKIILVIVAIIINLSFLSSFTYSQIFCEEGIFDSWSNTTSAPQGCWGQEFGYVTCAGEICIMQTGGCDYGNVTISWHTNLICR